MGGATRPALPRTIGFVYGVAVGAGGEMGRPGARGAAEMRDSRLTAGAWRAGDGETGSAPCWSMRRAWTAGGIERTLDEVRFGGSVPELEGEDVCDGVRRVDGGAALRGIFRISREGGAVAGAGKGTLYGAVGTASGNAGPAEVRKRASPLAGKRRFERRDGCRCTASSVA